MESLHRAVSAVSDAVWGPWTIAPAPGHRAVPDPALPRRVYCGLILLGATTSVELVWAWGDLMNGLQIFPNLVGLIGLSGVVAAMLRKKHGG